MSDLEALYQFRVEEAETTLQDALLMLQQGGSPRSIVNRAYYAMFYIVQAALIKSGASINTSKHSGVISVFDKEFILSGKLDAKYSKILHSMFDDRQESDYKDMYVVSASDATKAVQEAREFVKALKGNVQ